MAPDSAGRDLAPAEGPRVVGRDLAPAEGPRVVRRDAPEFPPLLRDLADPPDRLFVLGARLDGLPPAVAIVGARAPTSYGREVARLLAADLAAAGVCIVSGMARGIDSEAHEGALRAGGRTVAVLASGAGRPYPPANRSLYQRLVESGAVLSERPDGTPAHRRLFLERNRIIAGMSIGVVVVQARDEKSGALTTARFAMGLGRTVFAVPGDIRSELSTGPHALLRDGAVLCGRAEHVLAEIGSELARHAVAREEVGLSQLDREARAVLQALTREPARADLVVASTGLPAAMVSRVLTQLELRGVIGRAPGAAYYRLR